MRCRDEFMRMRIHARLDADHDRLHLARFPSDAIELFELVLIIDDDVAHAGIYTQPQVLFVLIIAMRGNALGREFCRQCNLELVEGCLLYTSPSPRDATLSRMPSSA